MKKNIPVYKPYFNKKEITAATAAINLDYLDVDHYQIILKKEVSK